MSDVNTMEQISSFAFKTGLKLNVTIGILSSNFRIEGWVSYFWIALIIGSAEFETSVCNSRFISKFKTESVKKTVHYFCAFRRI